jgi:hypothetical protein
MHHRLQPIIQKMVAEIGTPLKGKAITEWLTYQIDRKQIEKELAEIEPQELQRIMENATAQDQQNN